MDKNPNPPAVVVQPDGTLLLIFRLGVAFVVARDGTVSPMPPNLERGWSGAVAAPRKP